MRSTGWRQPVNEALAPRWALWIRSRWVAARVLGLVPIIGTTAACALIMATMSWSPVEVPGRTGVTVVVVPLVPVLAGTVIAATLDRFTVREATSARGWRRIHGLWFATVVSTITLADVALRLTGGDAAPVLGRNTLVFGALGAAGRWVARRHTTGLLVAPLYAMNCWLFGTDLGLMVRPWAVPLYPPAPLADVAMATVSALVLWLASKPAPR